ncbi:metallophosphoesterase family protein [Corynebacterium sp. 335C]
MRRRHDHDQSPRPRLPHDPAARAQAPDSPSGRLSRRAMLLGGAGVLGGLAAAAVPARTASALPGSSAPALPGSSPSHLVDGLRHGLVVTDLEVPTVTATSVAFSWATYDGPHPAYGELAPTVASDTEVRMAPADGAGPGEELPVVHRGHADGGYHFAEIGGLEPGRTYRFECRSGGIAATPGLFTTNRPSQPEFSGEVTTLTPPPGEHVATIALLNDSHVGELAHGIIVAGFPPPIEQAPGRPPFAEVMLAGALAEVRARGVGRVLLNGDCTSEARPAEVRRFREIMDGFGEYGVDWHVTRGNHDRPHTPDSDPSAGYEEFPVLEGTDDHRDPWGEMFVPRQELWTTSVGGLRVIGLDSCTLDASGGEMDDAQLDALEAELAADPHRPTLLLAHHPVTAEAAFTNAGGPTFTLDLEDSRRLQDIVAAAPGVFMVGAGHTHRANRTAGDAAGSGAGAAGGVEFPEMGAVTSYPGGYNLLHLHTGGYTLNFHRTATPEALAWTARSRWAAFGFNPEYLLGDCAERNFTVERDLSRLA